MKPQLLYPRISFSCILHDIRQVPAFPDAIGGKSFLIFSMATKVIYDAVEAHVEVHFRVLQRTAPIICIAVGYDHVSVRGGWAFQQFGMKNIVFISPDRIFELLHFFIERNVIMFGLPLHRFFYRLPVSGHCESGKGA